MKMSKDKIKILRSNKLFPLKQLHKVRVIDGEEGGTVWLGDAQQGISDLTVLPDSPFENVEVRFWWKSHGLLIGNLEFASESSKIEDPLRIRLSYFDAELTGVNEDKIRIYEFDEENNSWQRTGGRVDKIRKRVVGYVKSSSRYALAAES